MLMLTVSCVLYRQSQAGLLPLLEAVETLADGGHLAACFVDNAEDNSLQGVVENYAWAKYLRNPEGNTGFGRGHNLALQVQEVGGYHLILNPDVEFSPGTLATALSFMQANPLCGLLAPKVVNGQGRQEFLCKRYPSVLDLALRGFAPRWLSSLFRARLERYEMRDVMRDDVVWDPPLVSGCFMLCRGSVLKQLGGFDPDIFLYFEDYDLSLRTAKVSRIAYVPEVQIIHYGGGASRKGLKHIWMFCRSAVTFFNKHGWRWV